MVYGRACLTAFALTIAVQARGEPLPNGPVNCAAIRKEQALLAAAFLPTQTTFSREVRKITIRFTRGTLGPVPAIKPDPDVVAPPKEELLFSFPGDRYSLDELTTGWSGRAPDKSLMAALLAKRKDDPSFCGSRTFTYHFDVPKRKFPRNKKSVDYLLQRFSYHPKISYELGIPAFSLDGDKFLTTFSYDCVGMCGGTGIAYFEKADGLWKVVGSKLRLVS